ncbi:glycerophosphoryl diester phosphodiesterase membrane domain-containing protein [Salinibacterium sp.]|uniref:glycerophosphoryl diester phosphodiesterase membrane domain-containing protein n=1 Tax=Salinibacterium sp. TaxID=1915057 RepID=UPI00286A036D|nr:glycerophosphoryl diester phosphodiesterase membrane domain-containing protein [Salinibacterium sp.]
MSNETPWQSPAGPSSALPPSPYATSDRAAPPPAGAPGWTPPPKPGLIPLRPLTLGTLLGAAFQVLRRNPRPMFGFSLALTGLIFLVTLVVVGLVSFFAFSRVTSATGEDAAAIAAGATATIILSALVPVMLSIVVTAFLQAVVVLEVARGTVGEKLKLRGLWNAAKGRIGAIIGWALLLTGAAVTALAILSVVIGLIIAFGGTAGIVIGVILGVLAAGGSAVVWFWLGTRLCLVPSALMLERLPLRAAITRSWSLTTGYFWKTLGIQLLVSVIVQTVASIIAAPLQGVLLLGSSLINPNGDETGLAVGVVVLYILTVIVTIVFGAIAAVIQAATTALIYIDIRMRKEGLDLELSRFVEARQAGDTSVMDPYQPRATGTPEPQAPAQASPWS